MKHLYQQCELVSCFSLTIKDVGSYTKLSIYKAKNKSDRSTTNSALQILENSEGIKWKEPNTQHKQSLKTARE